MFWRRSDAKTPWRSVLEVFNQKNPLFPAFSTSPISVTIETYRELSTLQRPPLRGRCKVELVFLPTPAVPRIDHNEAPRCNDPKDNLWARRTPIFRWPSPWMKTGMDIWRGFQQGPRAAWCIRLPRTFPTFRGKDQRPHGIFISFIQR